MRKMELHKSKKKMSGILLMITALIIMQLPVTEADAATSASDFRIEGSTLVKYRGTETNVSVPDTVEVIGESAFEGDTNIELVVLPNSVRRIEPYAFWGCDNLDTVVLGRGLTEIGDYAFTECRGLEQMTIPSNVRSIGIQAFADCVNLTDITIPDQVTNIHETAFDGCYQLTIHCDAGSVADQFAQEFYVRQSEMPEYEDVPDYQYEDDASGDGSGEAVDGTADASGESGTQDDQTEETPSQDGSGTETLLGSTKIVGNQAVFFIDNTSPTVFDGSQGGSGQAGADGSDTGNDAGAADAGAAVNSAEAGEAGERLAKYTIVDQRIVADQAYYRNETLENLTLPEGIEEIGQFAFARSSVTQAVLPEGVERICYGAFYHCDQLSSVELPETVMLVEPKAFDHTAWVENFLENGQEDFLISGGVLVAYRGNASQVEIPQGVRIIAGEALKDHSEITSVTLPDTLSSIEEGAFEGCSGLSEIVFGQQDTLVEIKDRAFFGCALESVSLPASVERLGTKAFDEEVAVSSEGAQMPETAYETSAQRLSNEAYRNYPEETGEPGVAVTGYEGATASLEGAARAYTLSVNPQGDRAVLEAAFQRSLGTALPENTLVLELILSDNSGIPLTKLGTRQLTVTLPVPDSLKGEQAQVYTVDRNGQLEQISSQRILSGDVECIRFSVNQISSFGICGTGEALDDSEILEETVQSTSMSGPEAGSDSALAFARFLVGGALLITGAILLFVRRKREET